MCYVYVYIYVYAYIHTYIHINNRVEMREGPVSHRRTVERMIATQSSLFCCVAYLWVRLAIYECYVIHLTRRDERFY